MLTFEVDVRLGPGLGLWKHDLGQAIRLVVRRDGRLAIASQDVDRFKEAFVNILDELFDALAEDISIPGGYGLVVLLWKVGYLGFALILLPTTGGKPT